MAPRRARAAHAGCPVVVIDLVVHDAGSGFHPDADGGAPHHPPRPTYIVIRYGYVENL
jgi:hypothetical protein